MKHPTITQVRLETLAPEGVNAVRDPVKKVEFAPEEITYHAHVHAGGLYETVIVTAGTPGKLTFRWADLRPEEAATLPPAPAAYDQLVAQMRRSLIEVSA